MADGDIIHGSLGYLYQKPYKWLCEEKASSQECAKVLMKALLKDIKRKVTSLLNLQNRWVQPSVKLLMMLIKTE